jgi:alpha-glucosidase
MLCRKEPPRVTVTQTWLHGAAVYQVYPLSFRDANGDGWGDLDGVAAGLDHIASLGVDAVWLSPFYASPLADFGYDVTDHKTVDPRLGTLEAFDRVLAKAHGLGLRVLLDLVMGHTSDRHPWFQDSRRHGRHADWYVWADPQPDGTPPNNWLSVFGGSAWTWDPVRRQFYLHHFLRQQPSLNLRHPEVVEALMDVVRFWLARGADGFRIDAVDHLLQDPQLRSNPPAHPAPVSFPAKLFGLQSHVHDMLHEDGFALMERLRATTDEFDGRVLLAELSSQPHSADRIRRYTAPGRLHGAYTLEFPKRDLSAQRLAAALMACDDANATWWTLSNHDVERAASRWRPAGAEPASFEALLATLLACLPGTIGLYQGDELGLPEAKLRFEDLRDPWGIAHWPDFAGRDGARTPMPWTPAVPNGGFCPAETRPWLPLPPDHLARAVALQDRRNGSTLQIWRAALALRAHRPALRTGALEQVDEDGPVLAFARHGGGERIHCSFNLSAEPASYELPVAGLVPVELARPPGAAVPVVEGSRALLPPLGCLLLSQST